MCKEAPISILVCGDETKELFKGFFIQDCSAATQNILLAAHSLGLGSVCVVWYPIDKRVAQFRNLFKLPENIIPFSIIAIGYSNQQPSAVERYDEQKIHCNTW